jgi:radical SAM superfamily enzyme YgiQ (UPF0313 family)
MKKMHKITLLFPNFNYYEFLSVTPHQPSLSLGYLAACLKDAKIEYDLIDAAAENLSPKEIIARINKFNPSIVGITTNVSLSYAAIHHAEEIHKMFPKIKILMGGPWASAEYKQIIRAKYADVVVIGEGEQTLIELMVTTNWNSQNLNNIKGIAYLMDGNIIKTENRPLIKNVDEIPIPDWSKFPKKGYRKSHRAKFIFPLITSRGCPFNCKNCTKIIHGCVHRLRSIENVLKELDYLASIGAKEIIIEDDMFNYPLPRIKKLLLAIIKRNYKFNFQLSNGIRADYIDATFAKLLYAAGFYRAAIAIESGSQKVVDFLEKKLSLTQIPKSIKNLRDAHIAVSGYFILGLPIENYQSMIYSVYFANSLDLDIIVFLNLLVFPSTKLYKYIQNKKEIIKDNNCISPAINYVYTPIFFHKNDLNQSIVRKVQFYNIIRSFINPRRFFRIIRCYTLQEFIDQIITYGKLVIGRMVHLFIRP